MVAYISSRLLFCRFFFASPPRAQAHFLASWATPPPSYISRVSVMILSHHYSLASPTPHRGWSLIYSYKAPQGDGSDTACSWCRWRDVTFSRMYRRSFELNSRAEAVIMKGGTRSSRSLAGARSSMTVISVPTALSLALVLRKLWLHIEILMASSAFDLISAAQPGVANSRSLCKMSSPVLKHVQGLNQIRYQGQGS